MVFTLEALQAFWGDCLIVHAGPAADPRLLLIDGGPTATYETSLKPRLEELRAARGGGPLTLDMVLVSHIDGDHIQGIIRLAAAQIAGQEPAVNVRTLWHNAFDDVLGNRAPELEDANQRGQLHGAHHDVEAVIASVPEGRVLRDQSSKLRWKLNRPVGGLVTVERAAGPVAVADQVEMTVVAPAQPQLEALYKTWERWLEDAKLDPLQPAAVTDSSVFNRSSIVLLLKGGERTMLLTGDARGDHITAGLDRIGASREGVTEVDLLKLPHHGSVRNIDEEFFQRVRARHYVISANGRFGNPDQATLDLLPRVRTDDDWVLHLTNGDGTGPDGSSLKERLAAWLAPLRAQGRRFEVRTRADGEHGVRIDLGEPLPGP
jgi:beta-lactamase superfamily II metal-dependent hydrolase